MYQRLMQITPEVANELLIVSLATQPPHQGQMTHFKTYLYILMKLANQGFQSADSIHAINLLTSGLFTVNTMWIN